jgi:hypothetical protein
MPQPEDEIIRKRQRERSRLLAILRGFLVGLVLARTQDKMTINQ